MAFWNIGGLSGLCPKDGEKQFLRFGTDTMRAARSLGGFRKNEALYTDGCVV